MLDIANERRRFGCRRLFVLLRRYGEPWGINCIYRLHRAEELAVRKRRARRKARISQATYLNSKKKYDGLRPTAMCRLKQFEKESQT
ncbi:hypothetical protein ACVIHH_008371 [Bradyrhizobium sp. USDA 4518]